MYSQFGRALLQLLAQLADEDVDRAIAVGHRVAPDPLVDGLALEHLALGPGEQVEELELAPGQVEAVAGDEGLEAVGADLELAGEDRRGLGLVAAAAVAAGDRFDPRDRLLRVGGLGDPVVDPEAQAADPLGHGRAAGADDDAEVGEQAADPVEVAPRLVAEHRRVDQQGVQLHRDQLVGGHGAAGGTQQPARRLGALGKDGDETGIGVDHRETSGRVRGQLDRDSMHPNRLLPPFTGFSQVRGPKLRASRHRWLVQAD